MIDELRQEMLAEQAQRLARLELRNRIHMIGLLIWGMLLLGWMIYCFVKLMVMANRTAIMQAGTIPFTCGTCGVPRMREKGMVQTGYAGNRENWRKFFYRSSKKDYP